LRRKSLRGKSLRRRCRRRCDEGNHGEHAERDAARGTLHAGHGYPRSHDRTAQVPLLVAGCTLGATVAILVAVCMWPSQRLANGAGMSNWSSTRATMWLTMSSTVCGWL